MSKMLLETIILTSLFMLVPLAGHADSTYVLNCPGSVVKGAISFSLIGMYHSIFNECSGKIVYDDLNKKIKSVEISIKASSIESNCKWCDKIARSRHVLNAARYPVITFKSKHFEDKGSGPWAFGAFDLHGVVKNLRVPFKFKEQNDKVLVLAGTWKFSRKDFHIIFNKYIDQGGILIGDYFIVDWKLIAHKIIGTH